MEATLGPAMFKDAHEFYKACDYYQRTGNQSRRYEMPLQNILEVELFDGNNCILVAVDYVSNWVEVAALPTNDAKSILNFFIKIVLPSFVSFVRQSVMKVPTSIAS
ncbi:retroelement pol polyprotein-like [Gossypium australe]|uniref:Retroelement pol polyprotein-like n=1 Tax=Gossypium australe TaxID=47621 RepID=A0A5B6UWC9_9ROSI|nr:retroelement pol polyprotein-like [Gossypium australe]